MERDTSKAPELKGRLQSAFYHEIETHKDLSISTSKKRQGDPLMNLIPNLGNL